MTSVSVHRVRPADAGRARALRLEMLADAPLAYITTLAEAAERPHADYADLVGRAASGIRNAMFVADAGDVLVGQAFGAAHPTEPDRTMLYAVYVTPSHRGRGVLEDLVDAVAVWSRDCGRPMLELEVVTSNARAFRAYRKLGFSAVRRPGTAPDRADHAGAGTGKARLRRAFPGRVSAAHLYVTPGLHDPEPVRDVRPVGECRVGRRVGAAARGSRRTRPTG